MDLWSTRQRRELFSAIWLAGRHQRLAESEETLQGVRRAMNLLAPEGK